MKLSKKRPPAKKVRDKVDALYSKVVRSSGVCISCGTTNATFNCCHLKSRGELCLRAHPMNLVTMCAQCHRKYTMHPDLWVAFIESKFPGRWEALEQIRLDHYRSKAKIDWDAWLSFWKEKANFYLSE